MESILTIARNWIPGRGKRGYYAGMCISFACLVLLRRLYQYQLYHQTQFDATEVTNKVIVITGCSSGIGHATALKLNQLGFVVIATCRRSESVQQWLDNKTFTANGSTSFLLDITDYANIQNVKEQIRQFLDETRGYILWGIMNNAGVMFYAPFEFQSHSIIQQQIDVNLCGCVNVCHELLPLLCSRRQRELVQPCTANGGRIVNVSSFLAKFASTGVSVYSATKSAISQFTHCLRVELSPRFGIWCSSMELAAFKTNLSDALLEHQQFDAIVDGMDKEAIAPFYDIDAERKFKNVWIKMGLDWDYNNVDVAVRDIVHALTAKYPKRCYKSGQSWPIRIALALVKKSSLVESWVRLFNEFLVHYCK